MTKYLLLGVFFSLFVAVDAAAQQKKSIFKICGNPNAACSTRSQFKDEDIPFTYPKNYAVGESELFYAVIVKSIKIEPGTDCEEVKGLAGREDLQVSFPNNKVFYARGCYSIVNNYYTNVPENTIGLAVYAGRTKAEADTFLKRVKAAGFDGAYLKRIRTGFNGT